MNRLPRGTKGQMNVELSRHGNITIEQYHIIGEFIKLSNTKSVVNNLSDYKKMVGSVAYAKIEDSLVRIFMKLKEDLRNVE